MTDKRHDRTIEDPLSARLRDRRLNISLSLLAVATAIGISEPALYAWEAGTSRPSSLWKWHLWAKGVDAELEFRLTIPADDVYVFPDGQKQ